MSVHEILLEPDTNDETCVRVAAVESGLLVGTNRAWTSEHVVRRRACSNAVAAVAAAAAAALHNYYDILLEFVNFSGCKHTWNRSSGSNGSDTHRTTDMAVRKTSPAGGIRSVRLLPTKFNVFYVADRSTVQSGWSVCHCQAGHTTSMRPPLARLFTIVLRPGFSAIVRRSGL